jgi:hypothetical protein
MACLSLLESIRRRARRAGRSLQEGQSTLASEVEELRIAVARLQSELQEVKETAAVLVPPEPPRSGLNLSRRSEALRRLRKGESPSMVAAALNISAGEAELLGKVQRMLAAQTGDAERRPRPDALFTAIRSSHETAPEVQAAPVEP